VYSRARYVKGNEKLHRRYFKAVAANINVVSRCQSEDTEGSDGKLESG
jgi:hypothetical protein